MGEHLKIKIKGKRLAKMFQSLIMSWHQHHSLNIFLHLKSKDFSELFSDAHFPVEFCFESSFNLNEMANVRSENRTKAWDDTKKDAYNVNIDRQKFLNIREELHTGIYLLCESDSL